MPQDTVSVSERASDAPWSYALANGLGYLVNPLVLPPLLFGLVLAHFGAPAGEIGWAVGVSLVFFGFVPLGYVIWLMRRQEVSSLQLHERTHRTRPLLMGIASYVAALAVLWSTGATAARLIAALAALHIVNTLGILFITLRWKISVHTASLAGFVSMLLFVAHTPWPGLSAPPGAWLLRPVPVYALFVLLAMLMWARVRVGAHTTRQVWGGALFGLILPYVELYLLLRAGVLYEL